MPYVDKCQQLYRLFELVMLPAWVAVFVQPYGDLWRFLKYNDDVEAADAVAKFLVEVFLRAADIRARAVASSALTSWGLEPSQFLRQNHASLAEEMIRLFVPFFGTMGARPWPHISGRCILRRWGCVPKSAKRGGGRKRKDQACNVRIRQAVRTRGLHPFGTLSSVRCLHF